ncbi:hypothetical protein BCR35DRAFT_292255 [Leucosporidium creatinivorum]|uniref:CxC6 like cysteine cluster associated with KDZ domain-containing protein n=1 Tax=Leucosporidium creatinivorum TaxID=106004 RepID=A0A1Y2F2J0_9BASI|nr:hypothetical protein BCR35DRAFT_292255 [Leucosporidium creatinivorum]
MDGIKIGHAKCAYPPCSSNPLDTSTRRFCLDHEHYHSLCGVFGCDRDRKPFDEEEGEEPTQACEREDHQLLWRRWVKFKGQLKVGGFGRVMREKSQREKRKMRGRKVESGEESEGEGEGEGGGGSRKTVNMWSAGQMAGIQLFIHACGCPIAWEKFYTPESTSEVLSFLSSISSTPSSLPSYIAYDRACEILAAVTEEPDLQHWLSDTKFIVDAWHFAGHSKVDELCRKFCDPAPLDGSAPDLVVPLVAKGRGRRTGEEQKRVHRRAFNTEAAEQLNSWLVGFAPILRSMRADNFDFLLAVLLRRRFASRAESLERKHKGTKVG